ncbi:MAG: heme ABC transporter ATP-binding protein [Gemmatimonadota bacterium]|nr:heme ABC transporter ATP-binding protein [Gemmatimonadota bacterium]
MVEVRGVHYRVNDAHILRDVSVAFRPGRFNVILGPNGAGKSTLLKVATGLLAPTEGEVRFDGRDLRELGADTLARRRAVLSQHVELAFPLSVQDVVLMGRYPHYRRVPTARDRDIVDRALAIVDMTHKRAQAYPTLSGGEQQKVQLARVLAQIWNYDAPDGDKVLFLDEPTSSLDVHYQLHLLDVARELLGFHCTVIAVLHDLNVALQYGDAFVVLEDGRVAEATDDPNLISASLLERVFKVRARRLTDPESGDTFWRFRL